MHPIIFKVGPWPIYSYGLMMSIGFLAALFLIRRRSKEIGLAPDEILDFSIYLFIAGIVGARLLHVFLNFSYYLKYPLEIIMLNHGGLAYQGGLFCGLGIAILYSRRKKISFLKTTDYFIPYVALAQSLGRIGCFLNGCCYGKETSSLMGILSPDRQTIIYPTQLLYSFFLLFIFITLNLLNKKKKFNGQTLIAYLIFYGVIRFFIDFLRGDLEIVFLNLKLTQLFSIFVILFSIVFYLYMKIYGRRKV